MKTTQQATPAPTAVNLIGNAHLDPTWLWRWSEGFSEARATFASALERMREFPDFVFTASAAALYAWIERVDPPLFEEIRARSRGSLVWKQGDVQFASKEANCTYTYRSRKIDRITGR